MAGQIAEVARDTLRATSARRHAAARVLLVEHADRVLTSFPASLSRKAPQRSSSSASRRLRAIRSSTSRRARLRSGARTAPSSTSPRARRSGPRASRHRDLAARLAAGAGLDVDRGRTAHGRPDLTPVRAPGGDGARRHGPGAGPDGRSCRSPGSRRSRCSRAATPRARSATGYGPARRAPFRYVDKGNLATIGRSKAVAELKGLRIAGFVAWTMWLLVHLFYLIGFQNRLLVLLRWTISFVTRGRGARLIVERAEPGVFSRR